VGVRMLRIESSGPRRSDEEVPGEMIMAAATQPSMITARAPAICCGEAGRGNKQLAWCISGVASLAALLASSAREIKDWSIALARGHFSRLSRGWTAACILAPWAARCRALAAAGALHMHDQSSSAGYLGQKPSGNSPLPTTAWPMLTGARLKQTSTASGCPGSRWLLPLRPGLVPHPVVCSAPVLLPGFSPHIRPPLPARHTLRLAASPTPARPSAASSSQTAAAARLGLAALLAWLKSRPVGKACRFPRPGQSTMLMRE
jgi:hypothetical protein